MTDTQDQDAKSSRWKLSEAAMIAAVPAYGYLLAFEYESGYASFYGYDSSLSIISIELILVSSLSLLIFVAVIFSIINIISMITKDRYRNYYAYFAPLVLFLAMVASDTASRAPTLSEFLGHNWFLIFAIFMFYGLPFFSRKKHGGYLESLKISEDLEQEAQERSLVGRLRSKEGFVYLFSLVLLVFLTTVFAKDLGYRAARLKTSYLTFEDRVEYVVLQIYGDRVISSPLNRQEKTFENVFFVRPLIVDSGVAFVADDVGPLSRAETALVDQVPFPSERLTRHRLEQPN